jgi:hypothetical protein
MDVISTLKTSPARRWIYSSLVEGTIELTQYYIAFMPTIATEHIGFLQWHEFKSVRSVKKNLFRPAAIHIARIGGKQPIILCVENIDEWMSAISKVQMSYAQSTSAEWVNESSEDDK